MEPLLISRKKQCDGRARRIPTQLWLVTSPNRGCIKIEVQTGIDWISALPDSLIVQILSMLPIVDAWTTTILSKLWQNLWTCIHNLNCYRSKTDWSDNRFISFMDNALPLLTSSKIESFTLHLRPNLALSNYSHKLDKWLEIVLKKGVEDFELDVWHCSVPFGFYLDSDVYRLPQDLCSSSSILKLNCQYCRIPEDCILNWTSLKSLTLSCMLIREEHMEQITSNCHQLESLKLCNFCGFHRLHLTSPKCTRLELIDHTHPVDYMRGDCYFEIVAPYVQHLRISGDFDGVENRLGDLSSLIHADLTCYLYDYDVDDKIDKTIVKDHLTSIACAKELIISPWYIEVSLHFMSFYANMNIYSVWQKEDVLLPLLECKQLTINSWIKNYTFLGIANLLRSTPCLENLTIILPEELDGIMFGIGFFSKDMWDQSCAALETAFYNERHGLMDVLGDKYTNIFKCSLQNLKNLKVILQWTPCLVDDPPELTKLMNSLLEHAKNLEKLIIVHEDYFKRIENLLALLRVSNSTVVVSVESC
ncbi:putative F-box/LRR-repeat protein At5g02930 [Solanum dulcamara]|uniref:putative F-box/LRR-repeat protein At5g02930 n=1 Tax=Solanum dulcamara TaxID=45834 RepID=UPI0024850EA5|nr:putative F-box/LRR-repeat protein At5g02930 [Solanum dulcamara]